MKIDCVFSGGGVKAFAYIGALSAIKEKGITLERVAGTSAGAIVASLLAAGFTPEELKTEIEQTDLTRLLDAPKWSKFVPFSKWLSVYFKMGMYIGDELENWMSHLLEQKGVYSFADLKEDYLRVIVSDITLNKLIVIPDDLSRVYGLDPKHFSVATAVRMSANFPYFFMPKKLHYDLNEFSIMVDGGLLSNFPLWVFEHHPGMQERPVLGIRLKDEDHKQKGTSITNALEMFQGLFSTMKLAHDTRFVTVEEDRDIIYIPVEDVGATDFSENAQQKNQLITTGYDRTDQFLKKWPR